VQQNLKQIEIASQRAAELCQQMLAYAGKGRFMVHRVEIGSLVENTVPLLRASISKRALLKFELTPGLPSILADPTQMRQIVMNLVINASEAIGETDGEITITTKLVKPGPEYLAGAVLAPTELDRDHVLLQVQDTGSGMTPETMAKIFDPFFTTKFAGRGLGLAAVLGILRSHKGGVKVTSVPGKGSSFSLLFPVAAGTPEPAGIRRNTAPPWRQDGLALVVDDEDHVRSVAAGMLHSCGLRTETARDGYEALDLFRARPGEFDIILLDMTMPRLTGEETLVQMREIRPDIRVLFMSGYNRREVVDALDGNGTLSFIQKPFTLDSLREQLKVMLD
jgi:CheY-like chemotaxis protein